MKKLLTAALIIISLMLMLASCDSISEITVSGDGYLVVDGVKTEHKVDTADIIIVDNDGYLTVNGVKTEHKVDKDATVTLDSDGYVIVDEKKTEYKVHTADNIGVDDDGYLTVNGVKTEHKVDKADVITVNSEGFVVVNGVVTEYMITYCQHIFDTETVEATCTEGGYEVKTCQYCKIKTVNNKVDALGHNFSKTHIIDNNYHWYECSRCDEISNKEYHIEGDNGCCATCGISLSSTSGVIYDSSIDGTYAEVIGYTGTDTKVRIAAEYQGLPVKNIYSGAFERKLITSVVIPDSVVGLGDYAFSGCTRLTSVTIPDSVTSIGDGAFNSCNSLTSMTIGNSVTSIGDYAFAYCNGLTSVTIPDSVTSIGNGAFAECDSLTSVTIPDSVVGLGNSAFSWCDSLTSINVSDENTTYKSVDGNLYSKDGKTLIQYAIGKTDSSFIIPDSVTSIGGGAFYNCDSLTSVTIPKSVTSIGCSAFYNCYNLTSIKYHGKRAEWDAISKEEYWNDATGNYTITYNYTEE